MDNVQPFGWLTNCPEAAAAFQAADDAYDRARAAAINLPLAEKVEAYRRARIDRQAAYNAVIA